MKSIDKIRELYESWKKDTEKKYLSFSPFDAYLAGYTEGVREEEKAPDPLGQALNEGDGTYRP